VHPQISGWVISDGRRGENVLKHMEDGVSVSVARPILAEPLPAPPIATAVEVSG
jgi:hypothetical protein